MILESEYRMYSVHDSAPPADSGAFLHDETNSYFCNTTVKIFTLSGINIDKINSFCVRLGQGLLPNHLTQTFKKGPVFGVFLDVRMWVRDFGCASSIC